MKCVRKKQPATTATTKTSVRLIQITKLGTTSSSRSCDSVCDGSGTAEKSDMSRAPPATNMVPKAVLLVNGS